MNISELHKFIDQWRKLKSYPSAGGWPDKLLLTPGIWKKLSEIMNYTKGDGHEYAVNLFYVDGEIVVTPSTRGTRESVTARNKIEVKYEPDRKGYYSKKIFIDSKLVGKSVLTQSKVPKKIEISYLFNVHTHPVWKNLGQKGVSVGSESYSFFSDTDIRSFLLSPALVMGLLTDRLWLVCKTSGSIKILGENGIERLYDISKDIFEGKGNAESLIKDKLANWGLVFYRAGKNQSLVKVN
ncbi:hypothetical protein JW796_02365 [Candidatus Dojkabacteria bacterium]|nr:hypothetical protein [Candidatus Dojkabacteria bacterium]